MNTIVFNDILYPPFGLFILFVPGIFVVLVTFFVVLLIRGFFILTIIMKHRFDVSFRTLKHEIIIEDMRKCFYFKQNSDFDKDLNVESEYF